MSCGELFKTLAEIRCPCCGTDCLQVAFNPETLDVAVNCASCFGAGGVIEHMKLRELPCNFRNAKEPATH